MSSLKFLLLLGILHGVSAFHKLPLPVPFTRSRGLVEPEERRITRRRVRETSLKAFLPSIPDAFNLATFLPQPFWLLMIALPNTELTKKVMKPWWPLITFSLIHFFIVCSSISEPDGTAPMAEFAGVFDPSGAPLTAMVGMMKYPNFVSEEWSHVLTWDLFVGRFIWQDGLRRGIFTPHSVLLTNLIGPPGLLLHFLTCTILGKGLPPTDEFELVDATSTDQSSSSVSSTTTSSTKRADSIVQNEFAGLYEIYITQGTFTGVNNIYNKLADDVVWEDTCDKDPTVGKEAVNTKLMARVKASRASSKPICMDIDKVARGKYSSGFTYQLAEIEQGKIIRTGIRGTTFVSVNPTTGLIDYVREVVEPLFKPGSQTAALLRAVATAGLKKEAEKGVPVPTENPYTRRIPTTASDAVSYLWNEVQGDNKNEALALFADDIFYQDLNFEEPFVGIEAVSAFLDEFDIPGIRFVPERISLTDNVAGVKRVQGCCFTWRVEIAGTEGSTRGISFYEFDPATNKIVYIRDIPEPAIKPPPLQKLASLKEPGLKVFKPTLFSSV